MGEVAKLWRVLVKMEDEQISLEIMRLLASSRLAFLRSWTENYYPRCGTL